MFYVSANPHVCVAVPLGVSPCLWVFLRVRASLRVCVCVCACARVGLRVAGALWVHLCTGPLYLLLRMTLLLSLSVCLHLANVSQLA